jgi:poly(3-hydroxybutyrate) depolymerase
MFCQSTLPDAVVAGGADMKKGISCNPEQTPIMFIRGAADCVVPITENAVKYSMFETRDRLGALLGCSEQDDVSQLYETAHLYQRQGCPVGVDLELILVIDGGHDWSPDGTLDSTGYAWEFLSR